MKALILDCDGVLVDTERFGHLPAFNAMFEEFGLPVRWDEEEYGRRLRIGGGKERLASLLTPAFVARAGLPSDAEGQAAEIARWHGRKTAIYTSLVKDGSLPARPGIGRIVEEALDAGWTLAVASTSAEASVRATLDHAVGLRVAGRFAAILAGDVVRNKKPAPDIYNLALERLGVDRDSAVVIEDSANGLHAASAAGLPCLITANGYTRTDSFEGAAIVVDSLGDPGVTLQVLVNRTDTPIDGIVSLRNLDACLSWASEAGLG